MCWVLFGFYAEAEVPTTKFHLRNNQVVAVFATVVGFWADAPPQILKLTLPDPGVACRDLRGLDGWETAFFWSLQYFSKLHGSVCVTSLSAQSMLTQLAKDCEIKWWSHLQRLRRGVSRCMKCLVQSVRTCSWNWRSHPPVLLLSLSLNSTLFLWRIDALTNTWQIYTLTLCEQVVDVAAWHLLHLHSH